MKKKTLVDYVEWLMPLGYNDNKKIVCDKNYLKYWKNTKKFIDFLHQYQYKIVLDLKYIYIQNKYERIKLKICDKVIDILSRKF